MATRTFALILGIIFLLVGILGFVPSLVYTNHIGADSHLAVTGPGTGYLFGLFHVNSLHNLVHILFGIWGIAAFYSFAASRVYSRWVAIIYGILTIMGLFPVLNTVFGLIPIHGNDVWLHAIIAIVAAYFGWAAAPAAVLRTNQADGTTTSSGY